MRRKELLRRLQQIRDSASSNGMISAQIELLIRDLNMSDDDCPPTSAVFPDPGDDQARIEEEFTGKRL